MFTNRLWLIIILIGFLYFSSDMFLVKDKNIQPESFLNIDQAEEPTQITINDFSPIELFIKKNTYILSPVAEFRIKAMIASKKEYDDFASDVIPLDYALLWGKLIDYDFDNYLEVWQSNRWYYYKYNNKTPYNINYIKSHSANFHLIPNSKEIADILKKGKKKEIILLEGYLVNVVIKNTGRVINLNTSTSREDSGAGACEILLVTKVIHQGIAYE